MVTQAPVGTLSKSQDKCLTVKIFFHIKLGTLDFEKDTVAHFERHKQQSITR